MSAIASHFGDFSLFASFPFVTAPGGCGWLRFGPAIRPSQRELTHAVTYAVSIKDQPGNMDRERLPLRAADRSCQQRCHYGLERQGGRHWRRKTAGQCPKCARSSNAPRRDIRGGQRNRATVRAI